MKLSQRLNGILEFVTPCTQAADIGCDHGLLSAQMLLSGKAGRVVAGDISGPSLEKAAVLAKSLHLEDRLETRLGDGLAVLKPGEAESIVIAGMGAMLICKMLKKGEQIAKSAQELVLSPNNYEDRLRAYLIENGFAINREQYVFDGGRYYSVISAQAGKREDYSPRELLLGKKSCNDGGYQEYLDYKRGMLQQIVNNAALGGGQAREAERLLAILEEQGDQQ